MTQRKTAGRLSIFSRPDAGNVPEPWVPGEPPAASPAADNRTKSLPAPWAPAELPASIDAPAKRERTNSLPAPWVPAEPATPNAAPTVPKRDRASAEHKAWTPPDEAPRNPPAVVADNDAELPAPTPGELQPAAPPAQNAAPIIQQTIIVQQAAAPATVYVPYGWGCPRWSCPRHTGRTCWNILCSWW
jgi:hypothetical protein